MDLAREKDVERLRQAALLLEAENARLAAKVLELTRQLARAQGADAAELQLRVAELEEQLARRNRMLFAPKSEQRPGPTEESQPKPRAAKKKGHGRKTQPALQVVERLHELEVADAVCNSCGGQLSPWEGQSEDSEEVDVLERKFVLVKHRRQKYRCGCGGCVETALPPLKLFEGARYSVDWAIEVAVGKYLDHLPLERQCRVMAREGLEVTSQTLWDYLERLARLLTPAYERMWEYQLAQEVLCVDETRWPLLGAGKEERAKWHAWALASARAVFYRILEGRSLEAAREVLKGYRGEVVADGYGVYPALAAQPGSFRLSNCWVHVRREFIEASEKYPQANTAIALIGEMYAVEDAYKTGPPDSERLRTLRQTKSRDVLNRLEAWAAQQHVLPESSLGKALLYMGRRWHALVRFVDDVRLPLDSNAVERALRGLVLGRKNHYGSRSRRGTEVAAVFYSLLESAKLCGLEPKAYLRAAVHAALRSDVVPLPHELEAAAA